MQQAAAQPQSFTHSPYCSLCRCCKWWNRFVVLPLLVATVLLHSLQMTCSCCSSVFLNPNHFHIMEPLFLLFETISSYAAVSFSLPVTSMLVVLWGGAAGAGMRHLCTQHVRKDRVEGGGVALTQSPRPTQMLEAETDHFNAYIDINDIVKSCIPLEIISIYRT